MYREVHAEDIAERATLPAVRAALAIYRALAAGGEIPEADAVFAACRGEHEANLMVLAPLPDGSWRYEHYGSAVAAASGLAMQGKTTRDFKGEVSVFFESCYRMAAETRRPILTLHKGRDPGQLNLWERLILPVRDAGGGTGFVVYNAPISARPELLSSILHASNDGIFSLAAVRDADGRMVDAIIDTANRQASVFAATPLSGLLGRRARKVLPAVTRPDHWPELVAVVEERRTARFDLAIGAHDAPMWLRVTATPLLDGLVLTLSDVTDLRIAVAALERHSATLAEEVRRRCALEAELSRLARTDPLTGVLNRRGFEEAGHRLCTAARRYRTPLSLLVVDLDHFKAVNDRHGHAVGDAVLVALARTLNGNIRTDIDVVARIGGEEFVVVLPHTDAAGAAALAERLRCALAIGNEIDWTAPTASFGVATLGESDTGIDALVQRADAALYLAKRRGRNRVVVDGAPRDAA